MCICYHTLSAAHEMTRVKLEAQTELHYIEKTSMTSERATPWSISRPRGSFNILRKCKQTNSLHSSLVIESFFLCRCPCKVTANRVLITECFVFSDDILLRTFQEMFAVAVRLNLRWGNTLTWTWRSHLGIEREVDVHVCKPIFLFVRYTKSMVVFILSVCAALF